MNMEEQASPITLCIFEDIRYLNFLPLVLDRPVFDLFIGTQTLGRRIVEEMDAQRLVLLCRPYLAATVAQQYAAQESGRAVSVNVIQEEETIFLNGRLLAYGRELKNLLETLEGNQVIHKKGVAVAARLSPEHAKAFLDYLSAPISDDELLRSIQAFKGMAADAGKPARKTKQPVEEEANLLVRWAEGRNVPVAETGAKLLSYYWQLIEENSACIRDDFEKNPLRGSAPDSALFKGVDVIKEEDIVIGAEVEVRSGTVLDASEGPILIADGVRIEPNAIINGPCFIGANSIVRGGAKIGHGSSLGMECRVGGEVEESIVSPYTNKQHEGFLGHSYIGSWVNIGAGSCNSDLKNNYGSVKAWCAGKIKETGRIFLGTVIADHSKIAINTGLNTGTVVGFNSNVVATGFPPKFVPSFTWQLEPEIEEFELDKALKTARLMMDRRNVEFTGEIKELFGTIHRFCRQSGRTI
jgi:UDP-N-acetylglucosamine diphosphorylase/glucosamine-1-phosphate N-acetyltransferase